MITSVRFYLSYDPFKRDFIAFKMNIISIQKSVVDTGFVNEVTSTRQSVITRVVIRFFINDKFYLSFYAVTIALWKVTFSAIFLHYKVVHSVVCALAIKCMYHCTAGQKFPIPYILLKKQLTT